MSVSCCQWSVARFCKESKQDVDIMNPCGRLESSTVKCISRKLAVRTKDVKPRVRKE